MMYLVDNIKLPLNVEEKDIKNAIREKLGLHARSFRYEVLRKKVEYEPLLQKSHLLYTFSVETNEFVRNTSISFLPEKEEEKKRNYPYASSPYVISSGLHGLLFTYFLAKQGLNPVLLCDEGDLCHRLRMQGGYIYFPSPIIDSKIEDMYRLLLGNKVPLPGAVIFLSPTELSALIDRFISLIEEKGGKIIYNAKPVFASNILGRFRKLIYQVGDEQREAKMRHIIMMDQGKNASFYSNMKAKKTKSDCRLRLVIESRKKDADHLFFDNNLSLPMPLFFYSKKSKNDINVSFIFPFGDIGINNMSNGALLDPEICFVPSKKKGNTTTLVEISIGPNLDAYRYTISSAKRENLPLALPCQKLDDFLLKKETFHLGVVKSLYPNGIYLENLNKILGDAASLALRNALASLKKDYPYFGKDAILTGVWGRRLPGEAIFPKNLDGFVRAYWYSDGEEADLVGIANYAYGRFADFLKNL